MQKKHENNSVGFHSAPAKSIKNHFGFSNILLLLQPLVKTSWCQYWKNWDLSASPMIRLYLLDVTWGCLFVPQLELALIKMAATANRICDDFKINLTNIDEKFPSEQTLWCWRFGKYQEKLYWDTSCPPLWRHWRTVCPVNNSLAPPPHYCSCG